jgi:hypothetical protein
MARQTQSRRTDEDQPRGISAAAIEGAENAKLSPNADKLAQPGPGLSDQPRRSNPNDAKRNPDVEKWHDGSEASPDDFEWEVLDQ